MLSHKVLSIASCTIFLFSLLLLSPPSYAVIASVEGTVSKVSDGDTLQVITDEGVKLKIILYGCDAPETEKRKKKTGQISKPGQPYGEEAKQALKSKVYRKKVRVEIINTYRWRMVGMIWRKKRNINLEMVKEGYAEAYRESLEQPYDAIFHSAERHAKVRRKGIWGLRNYERPRAFRKRMGLSED